MLEKANALIIVDVQNDFCPGGRLPVKDGDKIIPVINRITKKFYRVIATQDWHPEDHISFAKNHPSKNIGDIINVNGIDQFLWPVHTVIGTEGAQFHPELDTTNFHLIIRKGTNSKLDSYSAFMENDKKTQTGLEGYLKNLGIKQVFLCGLATDYCVFFSAMDSIAAGFETYVLLDASRGVDIPENNIEKSLNIMKDKGIKLINSSEL